MARLLVSLLISLFMFLSYIIFLKICKSRKFEEHKNYFLYLKTFSGSFLLAFAILKLYPQAEIPLLIIGGYFLQVLVEFLSRGIEHGHLHKLHTFPIVPVLLGISIHSFLEAMPINFLIKNVYIAYIVGIILHKIPISIVLAVFTLASKVNKFYYFFLIGIIYAMPFFLGAIVGQSGLISFTYIAGICAGMLIQIGTSIITEHIIEHTFSLGKLLSILGGILAVIAI